MRRTVWRDGSVLLGSAVLAWLLFAIDLEAERINGILLLGCLIVYLKVLLGGPHRRQPSRIRPYG
ncbi:MAG: hypothetical protein L7S64_10625 [Longimicrobiales bacterium]|nr:hypothetical protein [Longimicrobiales bacterium]